MLLCYISSSSARSFSNNETFLWDFGMDNPLFVWYNQSNHKEISKFTSYVQPIFPTVGHVGVAFGLFFLAGWGWYIKTWIQSHWHHRLHHWETRWWLAVTHKHTLGNFCPGVFYFSDLYYMRTGYRDHRFIFFSFRWPLSLAWLLGKIETGVGQITIFKRGGKNAFFWVEHSAQSWMKEVWNIKQVRNQERYASISV